LHIAQDVKRFRAGDRGERTTWSAEDVADLEIMERLGWSDQPPGGIVVVAATDVREAGGVPSGYRLWHYRFHLKHVVPTIGTVSAKALRGLKAIRRQVQVRCFPKSFCGSLLSSDFLEQPVPEKY
jgi:hypothetical protein